MRLEGKVALITGGAHCVEHKFIRKGVGLSLLEGIVIDTPDGLVSAKSPISIHLLVSYPVKSQVKGDGQEEDRRARPVRPTGRGVHHHANQGYPPAVEYTRAQPIGKFH